jgi:hydrogenase maturation protease
MLKNTNQRKIVILGVGNLLLRDEGVGVHLIQSLDKDDLPLKADSYQLSVIDGGTSPELAPLVEGADKLIIIDAVKGGKEPGTIYRFNIDDVILNSSMRLSLHQMGVVDNLRMLELLGKRPKTTIVIGIEPKTMDCGLELSTEIQSKIPKITSLLIKELSEAT